MNLDEAKEILDKPCLVCKKPNRFHKVFWSPQGYFVRQQIAQDWNGEKLITRHWTILDNLEYLEYMDAKEKRR